MRPMEQITGHAEFCELFLDDVLVPKENLLGRPGQGWEIAMHVVAHERGTAALPRQVTLRTWLDRLIADAAGMQRDGAPVLADEGAQAALAGALIQIEVLRHHATRTMSAFLNGGGGRPRELRREAADGAGRADARETALEVLGDEAAGEFWHERYLYSRAASVYGGTQQIQRGIIADRDSLPAEGVTRGPRADRGADDAARGGRRAARALGGRRRPRAGGLRATPCGASLSSSVRSRGRRRGTRRRRARADRLESRQEARAVPYVDSAALAYVVPDRGRAALGLSEPGRSFAPGEPSTSFDARQVTGEKSAVAFAATVDGSP